MAARFVGNALRQNGMRVIDASREPREGILLGGGGIGPDVLVVGARSTRESEAYVQALRSNPNLKILTLASSSRGVNAFEIRLLHADVGPAGVVEAVRQLMHSPARFGHLTARSFRSGGGT